MKQAALYGPIVGCWHDFTGRADGPDYAEVVDSGNKHSEPVLLGMSSTRPVGNITVCSDS